MDVIFSDIGKIAICPSCTIGSMVIASNKTYAEKCYSHISCDICKTCTYLKENGYVSFDGKHHE